MLFSDELHGRIAQLPNVSSIKIPGVPEDPAQAKARIDALRTLVPDTVTIGVSGDWMAVRGLNAGCDAWYSVIGGTFPLTALVLTRAAQAGHAGSALGLSDALDPLWALFRRHGSLRVMSAAASHLGLTGEPNLPRPLRGLDETARQDVVAALDALGLTA
ncbi:dihydrodipicolinate synthase family protein [Streptomyces sp. NBC_00287]|uniref:dihydrodipicolinate synthase family protein n=1 Tax=Streptomyces sp. NBC_00287 TaxID=2975702 RepID=UPI002E2990C4|nr:dihydrodipicolinate synthase family protein [Streptomyces sp. NBC_00287]